MNHLKVISEIPLGNIETSALTTNAIRITEVTVDTIKGDSYIDEEIGDVKKYTDMAVSYPNRKKKNPFTDEMQKLAADRKNNLIAFTQVLQGLTRTTIKTKSEAALYLLDNIGDYSQLKTTAYVKVSGDYMKFIEKLNNEKAIEAMQILGIKDVFDEIVSFHEQFEKLYKNKVSTPQETPELSIEEIKDEIVEHLTSVIKYVDSKAGRKVEEYVNAANKINEIIADYLKVYKADKTRAENSSNDQQSDKKSNTNSIDNVNKAESN